MKSNKTIFSPSYKLNKLSLALLMAFANVHAAETLIVSKNGNTQGNGISNSPSINADGIYIAFESSSGNLVGDTNTQTQIVIKNINTNSLKRISVNNSGTAGNKASYSPSISSDGKKIAFNSLANNLVNGDNNGLSDIFVRDTTTNTTTLVSGTDTGTIANKESADAAISGDGRFVVFASAASNLSSQFTNNKRNVYIKDLTTGSLELISVNNNGTVGDQDSFLPSISHDGQFISFVSFANNFDNVANNNVYDVFLHDRINKTTERVSYSTTGGASNGLSLGATISADGQTIAYHSLASNLVSNDTNNMIDVFIYDRKTKTTELASGSISANGFSFNPKISDNGRFIAFYSTASNLVPNDTNARSDLFIYDRILKQMERTSVSTSGAQTNSNIDLSISISGDGKSAAFSSTDAGLVSGDTNNQLDVLLRKRDVTNLKPVSKAQNIPSQACSNGGAYVTLNGSGSYDLDMDTLTYTWSGTFGSVQGEVTSVFLPYGSHQITLTVTDDNGGSHSSTVNASVYDNTAPSVTAGTPVTIEATSTSGANHEVVYTANDNCEISNISISPSPGTYALGKTDVTVSVFDIAGNSNSDTTSVNVVDTTKPVLKIPSNITSEASDVLTNLDIGLANGTDIFEVTVSNNAPAQYPLGKTNVTWTAVDENRNMETAVQEITITDTTAPELILPNDISKEATDILTPVTLGEPTATDIFSVSVSHDGLSAYPLGNTLVNWSAIDANGNTTSAQQSVTIVDTTAPKLIQPKDISKEATDVLTPVTLAEPTATDIFAVSVTNDGLPAYPLGSTLVNWSATDENGNTTSTKQSITITDSTAPVITVPADITVEATNTLTSVDIGTAKATDIFAFSVSNDAPSQFTLGKTVVNWSSVDANNNRSTATQSVNVVDTTPPVVNAGPDEIVEVTTRSGSGFKPKYSVSDICNCGDIKIDISPNQSSYGIGAHTLTVTATDISGNSASDQMKLSIVDTTAPEMTVPSNIVMEASGVLTPVSVGEAIASDIFPVTIENNSTQVFPLGTSNVIWTATDSNGNQTTAIQTVTIIDSIAPTFDLLVHKPTLKRPNHKMRHVATVSNIQDLVDSAPSVDIVVTSNGDHPHKHKRHEEDWKIEEVNGEWEIWVRAEKLKRNKEERVYHIDVTITDFTGNASQQTTDINVLRHHKKSHDESHKRSQEHSKNEKHEKRDKHSNHEKHDRKKHD